MVESAPLPPADADPDAANPPDILLPEGAPPVDPIAPPAEEQVANVSSNTLESSDLNGQWQILFDDGTCLLSLSLTPWDPSPNLRASMRNCSDPGLADFGISSWRMEGEQVVLYAGNAILARLQGSSIVRDDAGFGVDGRFEGTLIGAGTSVAFFR